MSEYLDRMQAKACGLENVMRALNACIDDPDRHDLVLCLVSGALEIAGELNSGLDLVSRPKGGEA